MQEEEPDYDEQLKEQKRTSSLDSNMLTPKQYFLVNLSKFVVELIGTLTLGTFYILMGNEQTGMLLGFWVITLFAESISGAHFNPAVTLVFMLRKNSALGQRRLKGIIYMAGQLCGGILAGLMAIIMQGNVEIHPRPTIKSMAADADGNLNIPVWGYGTWQAYLSEAIGSFIFIFLFMLATDKKTQFSEDKVINCFILAASYIAARLMAGGQMVTCFATLKSTAPISADAMEDATKGEDQAGEQNSRRLLSVVESVKRVLEDIATGTDATTPPTVTPDNKEKWYEEMKALSHIIGAGPLLNPAIAFGIIIMEGNISLSTIQYILCPFAGSIMALIFYEQIYVKTQELIDDDDSQSNSNEGESGLGQLGDLEGEIEPSEKENENDTVQ